MGSSDRLRIAMTCARFPPMMGGTEVHVARVGTRLAERGHDVTVFTTALSGEDVGEALIDGMRIVRLRAWPSDSDLYITPQLRGRVRSGGFDVVHVQGYHTFVAPAAMSGARAAGVPYVVTFHSGGHSSPIRRALRPVQHTMLRRQLAGASQLIGVSDFEGGFFRDRLRLDADRFLTIPNGVDDVFATIETGEDLPVVSSVGRLEEYKGHHHVIEAFASIVDRVPGARLRVIGDGPFEAALRTLARDRGIGDVVEFASASFDDRAGMATLLVESRVVALASNYESQGIVGLEALATGAGLVVFDGSALADLGSYDSVDVVGRGSVEDLASSMLTQLESPRPVRRPKLANWDDVAEQVEDVYLDVTDRTRR